MDDTFDLLVMFDEGSRLSSMQLKKLYIDLQLMLDYYNKTTVAGRLIRYGVYSKLDSVKQVLQARGEYKL